MDYMSATKCPVCHGKRLRPESLGREGERDVDCRFHCAAGVALGGGSRKIKLNGREELIAGRIVHEIAERLQFLNGVGLGYISLSRSAATLSGRRRPAHPIGDANRIKTARRFVCAG